MTKKEFSRRNLLCGLTGAALGAALPGVFAQGSSSTEVAQERRFDVVVAGGGGAGLAAAVRAAELGARVVLLEKEAALGGNTLIASGYYAAVDPFRQTAQKILDSEEAFARQIAENAGPSADRAKIARFVGEAFPTLRWLEEKGVRFEEQLYEISGSLARRNHKPLLPNGEGYVRQLAAAARRLGVTIETRAKAEAIETDANGRARSLLVLLPNGLVRFRAGRGIVVATGGFGANPEMVARFAPRFAGLTHDNAPGATGEMTLAAARAGAALVDMGEIQCQPGCPPGRTHRVRLHNDVARFILIDKTGRRFVAEDAPRDVVRDAVLKAPGAVAFALVDDDGLRSYNRLIQKETVMGVESGDAWVADDLASLARQIGVDPGELLASVRKYNVGIRYGIDSCGKDVRNARLIVEPPFWAAYAAMTVHATMGGIRTTPDAGVLQEDGRVFPGLFAAGEAAGGLHGRNQLGGCGLADAFVFGKIAAESAVRE